MPKFTAKIVEKNLVAVDTYLIGIKMSNEALVENGMFFSFKVADKVFRSYSIAYNLTIDKQGSIHNYFSRYVNLINDEEQILFFLISTKGFGVGATFFKNINCGESVELIGPAGKFKLVSESLDADTKNIFVGTGTGLAPFVGFIWDLEKARKLKNAVLYAGLNGFDGDWITQFLPEQTTVFKCFNPSISNLPLDSFNGYVTTLLELDLNVRESTGFSNDFQTSYFYLCGLSAMVVAAEELLIKKAPKGKIVKEKFSI